MSKEESLAKFGQAVLDILGEQEDWNSDTFQDIQLAATACGVEIPDNTEDNDGN